MHLRTLLIFVIVFSLAACRKEPLPTPTPDPQEDVKYGDGTVVGRVLADGKALSGVVVSDGYIVDTTGLDGCFSLMSKKAHGYVFMSIPDGYDVPTEGVTPKYFARVGTYSQDTVRFTLTRDSRSEFKMFVFGDMHLADKRGDLKQFEAFVNDIKPQMTSGSFVVTLGDMSWDAFWDGFDITDYFSAVTKDFTPVQFFHTIGNHDHDLSKDGDWETAAAYKKTVGPTYYSFNRGGLHFIVLDDILCTNSGGRRSSLNKVSSEQIAWLQKDLSYLDRSTPLAIFIHAPLYGSGGRLSLADAMDLVNSLRGFSSITFFSGHTHTVYNVDVTGVSGYVPIFENCCGTVCGDWWYWAYDFPESNMQICTDGAPGGCKIVQIKNGKMTWQYKATGKNADYQFRTYDRNMICLDVSARASYSNRAAFLKSAGELAQPSSENLVYINVWDYDPEWTIEVRENGKSLEVKQLSNFKDPMYLGFMEAYCLANGYISEYTAGTVTASCSASTTNHIFSVKASRPDSTLDITVTDRFGRRYKESMKRPKALAME